MTPSPRQSVKRVPRAAKGSARRENVHSHLEILHTVADALSRSLDLDDVLRTALDALTHVTGHEISSLHLLSPDGKTLDLWGDRGLSPELREVTRRVPLGEGLIGQVAATGERVRVPKITEYAALLPAARPVAARDGLRAAVCVPIQSHGKVLGALSLCRRSPKPFAEGDVMLVQATADQIGLALENARLYSETRHQLQGLERAEQQLVQTERLSAIGRLAAGVAHEVCNPLTTILGQAQLLLMQPGVTADGRTRLTAVIEETSRAARILRSLLTFSRHQAPERRPCLMSDQAQRVLSLLGFQLEHDGVKVVTEFNEHSPVWADEGQMQQVLLNLVLNADQAMVTHPPPRVLTIRILDLDGVVRTEVLDTGPGISPEVLPRIFDPFVTTKPPGEGTGLGLWISYGIIEQHGGVIRAENRLEGGAAFVVELRYRKRS